MYNLTEAYKIIGPTHSEELWDGRFACGISSGSRTLLTNQMEDTLACYTFTLIRNGHLTLETNGHVISFQAHDLYIYLPGYPVKICSVSDDYESIVLLVDEQTTYETEAFRNLVRASLYPLIQRGRPKLSFTPEDAERLDTTLQSIRGHILRPTRFNDKTLEMLYSVFLFDLIDIQEQVYTSRPLSRRSEDLFIAFYTLLRQHYVEHHDLAFYAERLHVTTTYLSRIVRQTTGHTVVEHINQMLAMEATWLLTSSDLSVAQIADRLHFATSASFDKFFVRMRGKTPSTFRKK